MADNSLQTNGLQKLKGILNNQTMQQNFKNILAENAGAFMASILELYQSDNYLQNCDPSKVILEALKAATLKLPISKQLGFAYIIPYGNVPQFQMGYKGYIQLAQRSGQYRFINADCVCEGEHVSFDRVTGALHIDGAATSENSIGYFAYFQLLNGFEKSVYWTREKVEAHAKRYSKAWKKQESPWHTNFDAMAIKTVIRNLISKYGIMSVEMEKAIESDADDTLETEFTDNANKTPIQLPDSVPPAPGTAPLPGSIDNVPLPDPASDDIPADPNF